MVEYTFNTSLYYYASQDDSKSIIKSLQTIIIGQTLQINLYATTQAVVTKAIEYIEDSNNCKNLNSILEISLKPDLDATMTINGLLKLITIEDPKIKKKLDNFIDKFGIFPFIVQVTQTKKNEYKILINPRNLEGKISKIDDIIIERDCFKQTMNQKKTINTLIYKGRIKSTGETVAVKKICVNNPKDLERYSDEVKIMQELSGKEHFLKFYGSFILKNELFIVMEYIENSLSDMLKLNFIFTELMITEIMRNLVNAFALLEGKGIYHRDIKPSNIMMYKNFKPKIIDFGISKYTEIEISRNSVTGKFTVEGTEDFMSPELFSAFQNKSDQRNLVTINPVKADVYSLGITMLTLILKRDLSGYNKGKEENKQVFLLLKRIQNHPLQPILLRMLQYQPIQRPSFIQLLSYFSNPQTETI